MGLSCPRHKHMICFREQVTALPTLIFLNKGQTLFRVEGENPPSPKHRSNHLPKHLRAVTPASTSWRRGLTAWRCAGAMMSKKLRALVDHAFFAGPPPRGADPAASVWEASKLSF